MARATVPLNFNAFLEKAKAQKAAKMPSAKEASDTPILHHAFISIFIALWAVITHYVTILMPILSYFTRFT